MLVLKIKIGNSLIIGDATVEVLKLRENWAMVGVTAPNDVPISRKSEPRSRIQADAEEIGRRRA